MSTQIRFLPSRAPGNGLACAGASMLLLAATLPVSADSDKDSPGQTPPASQRSLVFPIESKPHGKSYGNWGAAWWSWALGSPKAQNPLFDTTGEFAHVNQEGPVFFLAGNLGGVNERTCSVPAGKALFFPVMNNVYWNPEDLSFVQDVVAPSQGWDLTGLTDEEILRLGVNWAVEHATDLSVTVDGVAVNDPWRYRAESDAFTLPLSDALEDFGYPAGPRSPSVADGYWIMLYPLSPGKHTIRFTSAARYSVADGDPFDQDFALDVTYHLNVVRPTHIIPPQAAVLGKTYAEWAAAFWQWGLGIPEAQNPLADATGQFCDEGQQGRVWFLGWSFGSSVEKSCTVPRGHFIFTPIYNWIFGAGVFDCDPTVPGVPCDVESLRASAAANVDAAEIIEVSIDGLPVPDPRRYRAASREPFPVTFPEGAVFGIPAGTHYPHVTDGYWLMLAPLLAGEHEIRIRVLAPNTTGGTIDYTSVYHLTVQ